MNEKGHFPSYIYRGYKSDIFEGGHRIPFLARWPNQIEAGSSSNETICLTDLLKTCAAMNGVDVPSSAGKTATIFCLHLLEVAHPRRFERQQFLLLATERSRFVRVDGS